VSDPLLSKLMWVAMAMCLCLAVLRLLVRQIAMCNCCGFVRASMKLGRVIKRDPKSIFRYGTPSDLTFGDL